MYILFTGAPGSKWSSVVKNIYWSDDVDHTDYSEARTYRHDADTPGKKQLMHTGAYFDPGMEFGNQRDQWDLPFSGEGKRIIKSHCFAYELDEIKKHKHPIVMVYRNDVECYDWWKHCGEFNITYPNYKWYENLEGMFWHIQEQNTEIMSFIKKNWSRVTKVKNNLELAKILDINYMGDLHDYKQKDIQVYVYK
jgi:hypothetical protein